MTTAHQRFDQLRWHHIKIIVNTAPLTLFSSIHLGCSAYTTCSEYGDLGMRTRLGTIAEMLDCVGASWSLREAVNHESD